MLIRNPRGLWIWGSLTSAPRRTSYLLCKISTKRLMATSRDVHFDEDFHFRSDERDRL